MKRKLHVTWRHRQLQLTIFGLSNQIVTVWNGLSLRFCHGHGIDWSNWIVGVVFVDWLLERWQSVNDCNEQIECDLKGNERRRGFPLKNPPALSRFSVMMTRIPK